MSLLHLHGPCSQPVDLQHQKLQEQWCSTATIVTMSHSPGYAGLDWDKSTKEETEREQMDEGTGNSTVKQGNRDSKGREG